MNNLLAQWRWNRLIVKEDDWHFKQAILSNLIGFQLYEYEKKNTLTYCHEPKSPNYQHFHSLISSSPLNKNIFCFVYMYFVLVRDFWSKTKHPVGLTFENQPM